MILILPTLAWGKEEDEIAEICEARFQKVESMAKETFGTAKGIALERDTSDGDCVINFDYPEKGFLYTFQSFKHTMGTDRAWEKLVSDFTKLKKRFHQEIQQEGVPSNMEIDLNGYEFRASLRSLRSKKSRPVQLDLICKRSDKSIACLQNQPNMDTLDNLTLDTPAQWPSPEWLTLLESLP